MCFKVVQERYRIRGSNGKINNFYCVGLYLGKYTNNNPFYIVCHLNKYFSITTKQYNREVSKFNTISGSFFIDKKRAQMAADYLNEKYIVPIKLIGK